MYAAPPPADEIEIVVGSPERAMVAAVMVAASGQSSWLVAPAWKERVAMLSKSRLQLLLYPHDDDDRLASDGPRDDVSICDAPVDLRGADSAFFGVAAPVVAPFAFFFASRAPKNFK